MNVNNHVRVHSALQCIVFPEKTQLLIRKEFLNNLISHLFSFPIKDNAIVNQFSTVI